MMNQLLGLIILSVTLIYSSLSTAVTVNVSGGILTGFSGLEIQGSFYDVNFVDGTCIGLFNGCNNTPSDFPFESADVGYVSAALGTAITNGGFGYSPGLIKGCEGETTCSIFTPWKHNGYQGKVSAKDTFVVTYRIPDNYNADILHAYDTTGNANVYAVYSVSTVPVPAAAWLFGSALMGFAGLSAKSRI